MDFIHTRDRLAPGEAGAEGQDFSQTSPDLAYTDQAAGPAEGEFEATSLSLPEVAGAQGGQERSPSRENTKTERSRVSGGMFPDVPLTQAEKEELTYVNESLDEMDQFTATIEARQVRPNQRLRSLTIDSTKSWTRPMPAK